MGGFGGMLGDENANSNAEREGQAHEVSDAN
jgi:hypothetical protein